MNKFVILFCSIIFGMSASLTYVSASCAQNTDWQEAPCFDVLPVNREEYRTAWESYYDHKGSEWMEQKKLEMFDAKNNGTLADWMNDNIANHNVFSYYHSIGEISFPSEYDRPFFEDDFRYYAQFQQVLLFIIIIGIILASIIVGVFIIKKRK
ncbi:exported hypothetical protein [Candidatus Nitrosotenuis uzonensis]|uniref:Uncharacterized protein n=2 Tax=Candidatus Nitrosotenuis uzonensis TaxID=1407055 RepID=V6AUW4_9ARCH|nr:exported hypothetical protein [Candidatus Nitrosotenuis uzonensis]